MTPSHHGRLDDVWRPRAAVSPSHVRKSPIHTASPGHSSFLGMSDRKSPSHSGSNRAGTPAHQAPPLVTSASENDIWCVQGAEAKLDDGHVCKVTDVHNNIATVTLRESVAMTRSLPVSALIRVAPKAGSKVRVVDGGNIYDAELLSIEELDGIIKLDNGEYKIIDYSVIAKLAEF